ncbi:SusC/RagA family TonB-linked outer membrane protein [Hufsiella ginkgonis]|uniref:SusC/RagA family TonB-linked outer membrane protein n=1 Tax=Hufsiella ginkgonis TaxID=2695274 RepID=A0A7K1XWT2_9SPHI|nr:TonB-dependent receptor [Hufsiella ginkgonis]MXV15430.1 SusC/RagA family TonB-linked outer membrane protein [Hufsiella ginkgonis]
MNRLIPDHRRPRLFLSLFLLLLVPGMSPARGVYPLALASTPGASLTKADITVKGQVSDDKGPLPGVSVMVEGSKAGVSTNGDGNYTITVPENGTLVFSSIGYVTQKIRVSAGRTALNVVLVTDSKALGEVVVVGYNTQKKATLTSSVSTVTAEEIVTTKNENILNTLSGKVPGLRIVQNTSEPGSFNNSYDIRGMGSPLIVIDGIPRPDIARVDPNDVESISIMKDASAAVYGVRSANGVILITTKKGKKGMLELNYTGTYGIQRPTGFPGSVDAVDYMLLNNEKTLHAGALSGNFAVPFSQAAIDEYRNGTKVSTDWHDATIKDQAGQTQHNLSATGGTDNSNYFLSLGYTGQDGILASDDLVYRRYNLRSNLSSRISKALTFDLNLSGTMDTKDQPVQDAYWVFRSMWYQPPINPVYANNNPMYLNSLPNPLHPVGQSTVALGGYRVFNNKWFQSSAQLSYEAPFLEGLDIKGLYSFDMTLNSNKYFNKSYNRYTYNAATDSYLISGTEQSPSTVRREVFEYPTRLARLQLDYNHRFGDHNVSATGLYEMSTRSGDNFFAQRELSVPVDQLFAGNSTNQSASQSSSQNNTFTFKNAAYVGSFGYDFRSKYIARFAFRYDGSSKFPVNKQWGFFPVGELGWRVSQEDFFKNINALSFINEFKLRGSYGETGDDGAAAYQFVSGYNYPGSGSATGQPAGSVFDGTYIAGVQSRGVTNPAITWYTSKTLDVGFNLEAWNGKLGLNMAFFRRDRTGTLTTQALTLPDVVGATLPQQNLNSDRNKGFDMELNHRHVIGKLGYNVKGIFSYTRMMTIDVVRAREGNSYLNWRNNTNGRNTAVYFGYGQNGQFENYNAIRNSPIYVNRATVVGDYRYEDWNGDGQVGVDDSRPIANTGLPLISYGLNLGVDYKGFDLNLLFQGAAMVYASYTEQLREPLWAGGNALEQFLDRYHPVDPAADPYDPNTQWVSGYYAYTGTLPFQNTLSNTKDATYVRLKSLEFGYSIPKKWGARAGIKNARVFFNGYNLFTITGLKFLDPEHPSSLSVVDSQFGYAYPIDKIFSFGLNVKF